MTQCKVIHVLFPILSSLALQLRSFWVPKLLGPFTFPAPPFALAMHLKCNQRKPKPKQTLLPNRQPGRQAASQSDVDSIK